MLRRLTIQLSFASHLLRHRLSLVEIQMPRQWIPRFVRPGKTHLQKNRRIALVVADPRAGRIADKNIAVKALLQMPWHTLVFVEPIGIGALAVIGPLLPMVGKKTTPIVIGAAIVERLIRRIFDNDSLVETAGDIARAKMHLANIGAKITGVVEILHPIAMLAPVVKTINPGRMRVHPRKDRRTRSDTGRPRAIGLAKRNPLFSQPVHIRRNHIITPPGADCIPALLVGHNQNDMGSILRHMLFLVRLDSNIV